MPMRCPIYVGYQVNIPNIATGGLTRRASRHLQLTVFAGARRNHRAVRIRGVSSSLTCAAVDNCTADVSSKAPSFQPVCFQGSTLPGDTQSRRPDSVWTKLHQAIRYEEEHNYVNIQGTTSDFARALVSQCVDDSMCLCNIRLL